MLVTKECVNPLCLAQMVADWTHHIFRKNFIDKESINIRVMDPIEYSTVGPMPATEAYVIDFEVQGVPVSLTVLRHMRNMISIINRNAGISTYKNLKFLEKELFRHLDQTVIAVYRSDDYNLKFPIALANIANIILMEGYVVYGWEYMVTHTPLDKTTGVLINRNKRRAIILSAEDDLYVMRYVDLLPNGRISHDVGTVMESETPGKYIYVLMGLMA